MEKRIVVAKQLLALAKKLVAEDEEEVVDEAFRSKLMGLKTKLLKLAPRKSRRLRNFGIDVTLRPGSTTIEDLVNVLNRIVSA